MLEFSVQWNLPSRAVTVWNSFISGIKAAVEMDLLVVFAVLHVFVQSKRRFERDCKEAERAQHICNRIDLDNKTDGEKVDSRLRHEQKLSCLLVPTHAFTHPLDAPLLHGKRQLSFLCFGSIFLLVIKHFLKQQFFP